LISKRLKDDQFKFIANKFQEDDILGISEKLPIWHESLDKIPAEEREYMIACLRRGEKLTKEPRILISTIHGVKGSERDNVALFTDLSPRTWKSAQENMDDELRVYYVGVTRAKENLTIMSPTGKYWFDI
jgi:superfamily I DNA/RNA helicase